MTNIRKIARYFWLFNLPMLLLGVLSMYGIPFVIPGFFLLRAYGQIAKGKYAIDKSRIGEGDRDDY